MTIFHKIEIDANDTMCMINIFSMGTNSFRISLNDKNDKITGPFTQNILSDYMESFTLTNCEQQILLSNNKTYKTCTM